MQHTGLRRKETKKHAILQNRSIGCLSNMSFIQKTLSPQKNCAKKALQCCCLEMVTSKTTYFFEIQRSYYKNHMSKYLYFINRKSIVNFVCMVTCL